MGKFADASKVPVHQTRAEIERLVIKYGATGFGSSWSGTRATIQFSMRKRMIRFAIDLPSQDEERFRYVRVNISSRLVRRSPAHAQSAWEQACRTIWRCLLLVIKAKLEAAEMNILTFEESFLSEIVMPGTGKTVWETVREPIALSYENHPVPLLAAPGGP